MKFTKYLILSLIVLVCSTPTKAQCTYWYSLNYGTYTSESYDGTNLYTSVLTDGSASMGVNSNGCPDSVVTQMEQAINSATHQPGSYNAIGSNGSWQWGNSSCVSCYISEQNNNSVSAPPGNTYSFQPGGKIYCSVGGAVFYTFPSPISIRTAVTNLIIINTTGGICYYKQYCATGTPSCPVSNEPTAQAPCLEYLWAYFLVINGHCGPIGATLQAATAHNCT